MKRKRERERERERDKFFVVSLPSEKTLFNRIKVSLAADYT